jgi:peptide/nickel transport system substrate-binding protein
MASSDPAETPGLITPVYGPLRAARRDGEADAGPTAGVYSIRGELAEELRGTPGLILKPVASPWDPQSPWHDERVRRAANLALGRKTINEALTLGYSKLTNSIVPVSYDFYWQPPPAVYDQPKAKRLLAEAGRPGGFDAGDYYCDSSHANVGEAVLNNLQEIGIRSQLRPIERAAFGRAGATRRTRTSSNAAAERLDLCLWHYPDIDALAPQQAAELYHKRRTAIGGENAAARA